MVDNNMFGNLTDQEIKEMINKNRMALEKLDVSVLRRVLNYETDMLCVGKGDVDLICRCADLLDEKDPNPMTNDEFMHIIEKSKKEYVVIFDPEKPCRIR